MLPTKTTIRKPGSHWGVRFLRAFSLLLCLLMALSALAPFSALASEQERKTVRVGWYDSSYCHIDQFGRRSGSASSCAPPWTWPTPPPSPA